MSVKIGTCFLCAAYNLWCGIGKYFNSLPRSRAQRAEFFLDCKNNKKPERAVNAMRRESSSAIKLYTLDGCSPFENVIADDLLIGNGSTGETPTICLSHEHIHTRQHTVCFSQQVWQISQFSRVICQYEHRHGSRSVVVVTIHFSIRTTSPSACDPVGDKWWCSRLTVWMFPKIMIVLAKPKARPAQE